MKFDENFTNQELMNLPKMVLSFLAVLAKRSGGSITITADELQGIDGNELQFEKNPTEKYVKVTALGANPVEKKGKLIEFPKRPVDETPEEPTVA